MYVLKTRFSSYVTGVVAGTGMIVNRSDRLAEALTFDEISDVISFLRGLRSVEAGQQNELNIHRVEAPDPVPVPSLVDMGPV